LLPVSGADLVLGAAWLATLGPQGFASIAAPLIELLKKENLQ